MKAGLKYACEVIVGSENTALTVGSGDMEVLATPSMIALMERAAMLCVAASLSAGFSSVGTMVEVAHTRATHVGGRVTATAELMEIDGRRLVFRVEASDERGVVGHGLHERFVVEKVKFLEKL
jgi:predicted thioesterase